MAKTKTAPHREECYTCFRVKRNCLCDSVRPFATRMRFVILMHTKEARKQRTGTARLAGMCLKNAELFIGTEFAHDERVNALLRAPAYAPFVLYPGPKAVNFKEMDRAALPAGKTPLVFVIDGTWNTARTLLNKSPNVKALPRLSFARNYLSRFAIKRQPKAHCVSTIEAVYHLCREAEEGGHEKLGAAPEVLMEILGKLVDIQLRHSRQHHHRREDNKKIRRA
ncbi:MAG: DTW domain containing protein [Elusimicrobia bacterium]|nr:MAG: DTW domain containing protein [Elusimicrobiota bacterium]KAF0151565.1 MAG: DTW domain containing protein [Elusimicrobiota bacterium]